MSEVSMSDIIYTKVDEAPELASASWLPIVRDYLQKAGITVGTKDISLAARIIASFPENSTGSQKWADDLRELGVLVTTPEANVIKLPNISASVPQLKEAIRELQGKGYALPDYPENPETPEEKANKAKYDKIKGSAVNPVLREGNSDRRVPRSVKEFARRNPHSMGEWRKDSKTHVATMTSGDFFANEKSITITKECAGAAKIEFVARNGTVSTLKENLAFPQGAVVDATFMSRKQLIDFLESQIQQAKQQGVLFSLHMKATMMKVSDPIIFGHAVRVYFKEVFEKHAQTLTQLRVDPNYGLGDLLAKIQSLPPQGRQLIEADIRACMETQPPLYMVNSDKGITNLHVPSDVIIDASMPALIRAGGKGWGPDGKPQDAQCVIPDSSYAGIYQAAIDFCKKHGAMDPSTMGSVSNVGLMAQKAEEYGSHGTTFPSPGSGIIRVVNHHGDILLHHAVEEGDIWRLCQTRDEAIRDWVKLAINRARISAIPAIFWLDEKRAHDAELIKKIQVYFHDHDIQGLDIRIMAPHEATHVSLQRAFEGLDTISVTGNVLRDYNTDLFPILEVGTSAKMLSIVPLMQGGGLFETGAGGSAPKLVQQFLEEGHLRWDSLGEFAALAASLDHLSRTSQNPKAALMAKTLDQATEQVLLNNKSPKSRKGELDNRGSHYYLALYWAQALAAQNEDLELNRIFAPIAAQLEQKQLQILEELNAAQKTPVDLGGYYFPDPAKLAAAMRPSQTFNAIIGS
ncbi:MAG: NADP-dependent isocitrate dehydrogenase [Nitrospirae bacterium]|nr:NADP-dependent isocitrate dehydrogenase [Magnetococcales bacterium]HAT49153.1 NADP-dependent isocitrate dehydrogenase [Alphaproteobacteria bacterium]